MGKITYLTLQDAINATNGHFDKVLYKAIKQGISEMTDEQFKNAFFSDRLSVPNREIWDGDITKEAA